MSNRVDFAGLVLELLPGWYDVTDDLGPEAPYTLGKAADAVGALQISVAHYKLGKDPEMDAKKLREMLLKFFREKKLGPPVNVTLWSNGICGARGDFKSGTDACRIWYVSNGRDVALVTYTTEAHKHPLFDVELGEAEAMVKSICFPTPSRM
jgi:hypothetical protein